MAWASASLKSTTATSTTASSGPANATVLQCERSPALPLWLNGIGCGGNNGKFSVPLRPGNGVIDLDVSDDANTPLLKSETPAPHRLKRRSHIGFDLGEQDSLDMLQAGDKKQTTYHAQVTDTQTTVGVDLEMDFDCHEPHSSPPRVLKANWSCMDFASCTMQVDVPANVSENIASERVNACIHPEGLKANWSCMVLPDDP